MLKHIQGVAFRKEYFKRIFGACVVSQDKNKHSNTAELNPGILLYQYKAKVLKVRE
uniref:Uncharacterized protein n=1 Tax=Anguilla anguilla TaxID=7936 RepID=A0A0E9UIF6_ANGAN